MWNQRLAGAVRAAPALALAASTLLSTFGLMAPPAVAATPPEPAARLQLFVKDIDILDDREGYFSGKGDMYFRINIWHCETGKPAPCMDRRDTRGASSGPLVEMDTDFHASTGDTVPLHRIIPSAVDAATAGEAGPGIGFPVYPGQSTVVQFEMHEEDDESNLNGDEFMGSVYHILDTGEHGLGIGPHAGRATGADGGHVGDYIVHYEIRGMSLPDLRPVNIQIRDLTGSAKKLICMAVQNIEPGRVGSFEVALKVDGVVPPGGRLTADGVPPGDFAWECIEPEMPTSGQHQLSVVVDESRTIPEYNETNNTYIHDQPYVGVPVAPTPTPVPTPSATKPDLTVSTIKVNGQAPDSKDDCKNDVIVVVKNGGMAKAGDFTVRLVVDDDQGHVEEQTVDGLDAGKESQVTFRGVQLKKGTHSLTATADATAGISESNEGNNALKVTARCHDDR